MLICVTKLKKSYTICPNYFIYKNKFKDTILIKMWILT